MAEQITLPPVREKAAPAQELNFLPPPELGQSVWQSLRENLRSFFKPEKLPPLQLTSKPVEDAGLMLPDESLWHSLRRNLRETLSPEKLPPLQLTSKPVEDNRMLRRTDAELSLFGSLRQNIHSTFFPEKLPPLQVSSKPIRVKSIWGSYDYKQEGAGVSLVVHVLLIGGLIGLSILTSRTVKLNNQAQSMITLTDADVPPELPMTTKKGQSMGGGGGGGDRDKIEAPKGKLPKASM